MALQFKGPESKPNNMSSNPRTHVMKRESQLLQAVL